MDDEGRLRTDMERATLAQQILENPLWPEAFTAVDALYIDLWRKTKASDTVGRDKLWWAQQVILLVRSHLETVVANGQLAAHQVARDFQPPKRFGIM